LARSLEYQVADVEREVSAAFNNYRRAATITGAAESNLKRLETEAQALRLRLHKAKAGGAEPGYRYDLGKCTENISRAEILVESCRPSIYVHDMRIEKYEEIFSKLCDEGMSKLVDVDIRKNEEEDMMRIPRADKFHLPRVGSFEVFLQYFVPIPPPTPEPALEGVAEEGEAANGGAGEEGKEVDEEEGEETKPKKPKERAVLIRLFSKLQTKKWPNVPKVIHAVRMFLPSQFDRLAKEEEEARQAAVQARVNEAAQRVKDAKALIESNKANAEGKVKEAEEMRESSADVIQAFEKMQAEKEALQGTVNAAKEKLKGVLVDQKAAQDEVAELEANKENTDKAKAKVEKLDGTVKSVKRGIKDANDHLTEFEPKWQESKDAADGVNEQLNILQGEYDAFMKGITTAQQELVDSITAQKHLHVELGMEPPPEQ